jgi:hypothetical protein
MNSSESAVPVGWTLPSNAVDAALDANTSTRASLYRRQELAVPMARQRQRRRLPLLLHLQFEKPTSDRGKEWCSEDLDCLPLHEMVIFRGSEQSAEPLPTDAANVFNHESWSA